MQVWYAKSSILNNYLALRSITAAPWLYNAPTAGFLFNAGMQVLDFQAPRAKGERPSAVSNYTQSRPTANRVYDSKARRFAEDNRIDSNCTHL